MPLRDAGLARRARLSAGCLLCSLPGSPGWISNLALSTPRHVPRPQGARGAAALGAFPTAVTAGAARSARVLMGAAKTGKSHPCHPPHRDCLRPLSPSAHPLSAFMELPGLAGRSGGPAAFPSAGQGLTRLCLCSSSLQASTAAAGTCSAPSTGTPTCTPAPTTTRQKPPRRSVRKTPSLSLRRSRSCEGG